MAYKVGYTRKALEEDLPWLDAAALKRIRKAIEQKLVVDPMHYGKPLQYDWAGARSLRVGDYRIIYETDREKQSILILAIGHRRDIYER